MTQSKKTATYRVVTDAGGGRSFRFYCDISDELCCETTLYDFYRSRHRCCPGCGVAVTEVAVYCPECGARLPKRREAAV